MGYIDVGDKLSLTTKMLVTVLVILAINIHYLLTLALVTNITVPINMNTSLIKQIWIIILKGDWLIEFYAPWCPACKNFAPTYKGMVSHLDS